MPLLPPTRTSFGHRTIASAVLPLVAQLLPPLSESLHKGQCGRIAVVGGSATYTGAPYFASITALKVGCDMVHVFCPREAALVIKSYSPELMVHPSFDKETLLDSIHRVDAVVLGPGLGRDAPLLSVVQDTIAAARENHLPLVIDADGLFLLCKTLDSVKGYTKAILTPNYPEFLRLYESAFNGQKVDEEKVKSGDAAKELAKYLGCTLFQKGPTDIITDGNEVHLGEENGSPRRCGGQGDLLSGTLAVLSLWAEKKGEGSPTTLAGRAGSQLIRIAAKSAFASHGRSMLASHMIDEIPSIIAACEQ